MKTGIRALGGRVVELVWLFLAVGEVYGQTDSAFVQRRDWLSGQREELPDWLTGKSAGERFIAVSDPGLKPEVAREQALLRASFLCALRQGMQVEVVTDYFSSSSQHYEYELSGDKLVSLFRLEAALPTNGWRLGREWENRYGEYAVEVFPVVEESRDSCCGRVEGELMLVSSGGYRERNEIRCAWTSEPACPARIRRSSYLLKGSISDLSVETRLNDTLVKVPREGYWYIAYDSLSAEADSEGYPARHGLWCAQMQSLLHVFVGHAWSQVQTKILNEKTDAGTNSRGLRREVVRSRLSVTAGPWNWKGDCLEVKWRTKDFDK